MKRIFALLLFAVSSFTLFAQANGKIEVIDTAITEDARASKPIEDVDTEMQVEPEVDLQNSVVSNQNNFTLSTNLLYWLGGLMNVGAEYKKIDSNFGVVVNGGYSPFGDTDWNHNLGGWFIAPELRFYMPNNEKWFIGAQFLASGYNYKLSDTGYQGTVIGGGLTGGYKLRLSDTFDMGFTLGLGYGHFEYDTYYHDNATNTNPYISKGVTKNSLMPIQAGINLIWKIK
ncbi:MAG: DUF3575 domain-containing protein [Rikenellaceae bacterium]